MHHPIAAVLASKQWGLQCDWAKQAHEKPVVCRVVAHPQWYKAGHAYLWGVAHSVCHDHRVDVQAQFVKRHVLSGGVQRPIPTRADVQFMLDEAS